MLSGQRILPLSARAVKEQAVEAVATTAVKADSQTEQTSIGWRSVAVAGLLAVVLSRAAHSPAEAEVATAIARTPAFVMSVVVATRQIVAPGCKVTHHIVLPA